MLERSLPRKLETGPQRVPPHQGTARPRVDRIPDNLKLHRKAIRRKTLDARQLRNAIQHLLQLPAPGESLHFIVDGRFEPCDLIPAVRILSDPATIRRLDVTTLGLNSDNVATIAAGLDQGKLDQCSILVSHYFKSAEPAEYEYLRSEIESRGGRVNAMRTHAKLILLEMTDGNHYTIEGSGNLRACRSIEQFVLTNDRDLLLFHRGWIDEYINSRGDGTDLNLNRKRRADDQANQTTAAAPGARRAPAQSTDE